MTSNSSEEASRSNPVAQVFLNTGLEKLKRQNYRGAIADFRQAIALKPDFAIAYAVWGNTCFAMKDYQSAIPCFDYAIQLNPRLAPAYGSRGLAHYELGNKQQALDDLTQSIQLDPKVATSHNSRGQIYLELDNVPQALADFEKAIDLFISGEDRNLNSRALAQIQKYYRRGIAYHNTPSEPFMKQAFEAERRGAIQVALTLTNEAIELTPKQAELYYYRASTYQKLEQYPEALADFGRAIELNPRVADFYYNRGCIYFDQGNDACIADFEQAIKLDPELAKAYYNLGSFYIDSGNQTKGVTYVQQAGMIFQQLGDRQSYDHVMAALRYIEENL